MTLPTFDSGVERASATYRVSKLLILANTPCGRVLMAFEDNTCEKICHLISQNLDTNTLNGLNYLFYTPSDQN